jgi:N-acetylneuraminic acid mutarotase
VKTVLLVIAATLAQGGAGHWSSDPPLPEPIQELSAAVLHGRIYVAGGIDGTGRATAAAFRYDPLTSRWERIANLPAPRHHMPLAVVSDTLYAVGGLAGQSFVPVNTLWLYREGENRWEPRAPLPAARGASGVGTVGGKLIVVGGWGVGRRLLKEIAIYDPTSDVWHDGAAIPTPRDHLTAAAVAGVVYAIGGRPLNPDRNYDVLEAYDLASDRWTKRSSMPSRRGGLAAAVVDGRIHVVGGETRNTVFANHEVYEPATDHWAVAAPLPVGRHGLAAAAVGGKFYVIGGGPRAGFAQTDAVDVYAP